MAEIKNETSLEKETSLNEWKPLSTDIELMAFFAENPGLSGLITEENYKAPSEYMRTEYHQLERTFKRYYE
ncbi:MULTISPECIES: hypothetical protein [Leuconostoc]|uniref:hypothetical protein n=1 Tax=Leuconostoc TaxID=1243 RepID=UPI0015F43BED|nr:hypothetical protein [Leuconostoc citreum]MBA5937903.1 hypothetical protein [Leuconostoc citreum]